MELFGLLFSSRSGDCRLLEQNSMSLNEKTKFKCAIQQTYKSRYSTRLRSMRMSIAIANRGQLNIAVAVEGDVNQLMMQLP